MKLNFNYKLNKQDEKKQIQDNLKRQKNITKIAQSHYKIVIEKENINYTKDLDVNSEWISSKENVFSYYENINIKNIYDKKIKYIYNVYQPFYNNNKKATGFGDFLRGSYFLLQFCKYNNFNFDIIINHPISIFLKNNINNNNITNASIKISYFEKTSINEPKIEFEKYFLSYLYDTNVHDDSLFVYTISFPFIKILPKEKDFFKEKLEPNDEMKLYIESTLNKLLLVKKTYIVIHIRSGDNYLNNTEKSFSDNYLNTLYKEINDILKKNPSFINVLIIADNNYIKKNIGKHYTFFKFLQNNITHFGEGIKQEREKIKNTLLDFYLMSYAMSIYSFSVYEHGTGFSRWCAETYDVPYSCTIMN